MTRMSNLLAAASLLGGLVVAGAPGRAQAPGAAADGLRACGAIQKKSARLACYDRLAGGVAAPAAEAPAAAAPAASFGQEQVRAPRTRSARGSGQNEITVEVKAATDRGIGHWLIVLADGAVWQMTEASPNFRPPRPGDTIRIRKGALGGYLMDVDHQVPVRVRRLD